MSAALKNMGLDILVGYLGKADACGISRFVSPGIYFLHNDDRVVYCGKASHNILGRICLHLENKEFDSFSALGLSRKDISKALFCDGVRLVDVEGAFIRALRPKYNHGRSAGRQKGRLYCTRNKTGFTDETLINAAFRAGVNL